MKRITGSANGKRKRITGDGEWGETGERGAQNGKRTEDGERKTGDSGNDGKRITGDGERGETETKRTACGNRGRETEQNGMARNLQTRKHIKINNHTHNCHTTTQYEGTGNNAA